MIDEQIRQVLADNARMMTDVASLGDDADLYQAGMTSAAMVSVMLALEETFDIEFTESMLQRGTFQSIAAIRSAVTALIGQTA